MKKIMSLILTMALLLTLAGVRVGASDVVGPLELSEIEKIDKAQIHSYSVNYKGKRIYNAITDEDLDYFLEIFSNEKLNCINSEIGYETSGYQGDGCITIYMSDKVNYKSFAYQFILDSEKIFVTKPQIVSSDVFDKKLYQGWFEFKDKNTYDELIAFLEKRRVEDEEAEDKALEESMKNKVAISDFKILYTGIFQVDNYADMEWGVCSYIRAGEDEPVVAIYHTLINLPEYKDFLIYENVEENNTVTLATPQRVVTLWDDNKDGYEYDSKYELNSTFKLQVNVTENMTAESIRVTYMNHSQNVWNTVSIDMSKYKETGRLPEEFFVLENNINYEEPTDTPKESEIKTPEATEQKQEETKSEENKQTETKTEEKAENDKVTEEKTEEKQEIEEKIESDKVTEKEPPEKEENKEQEQEKDEPQKTEEEKEEVESESEVVAEDFIDVPKEHWAYDNVKEFSKRKIVLGYGNGYFGAEDSVTYEHFGLLLDRMFDYKAENNENKTAIREYIIVSLVKALKLDVTNVDENIIEETFTDCYLVKPENRKYIAKAIEKGLVVGYEGRLSPKNRLTRAETVTLLARAEEL